MGLVRKARPNIRMVLTVSDPPEYINNEKRALEKTTMGLTDICNTSSLASETLCFGLVL